MTIDVATTTAFPHLRQDLDRVHRRLSPTLDGYPKITVMLRHLFGAIPKLVRPTLSLMSAYAVGDPADPVPERAVEAAALVELMHVGTMCHDDVMDEADRRRDRPSVNAQWGNCLAILAGDHLLAAASEAASTLGQREALIGARTLRALIDGQMVETIDRYNSDRTEQSYFDAITGKTGWLMACACMLGAIEAGANDEQIDSLGRFGRAFGVAFQINDDVLDLVQDEKRLGKPAGNDLLEGIYTLPVIRAMAVHSDLRALLTPPFDHGRIPQIRAALRECGAIDSAATAAAAHLGEAVQALTDACGSTDATRQMTQFATDTLNAVGIAGAAGEQLFYRAEPQ